MHTETRRLIDTLIAFDTTSRNSNLELIHYVRDYLAALGVACEFTYDTDRRKANLFATLGEPDRPGLVLSGHTDVVPVDGQDWHTDPYQVIERDGRLYARGCADMKSFLAVCMARAHTILDRGLATPIHFAFSFDEEVGCLGVRSLIAELARRPVKPYACIIGEPTSMRPIRAHKGKLSQRCTVHGLESHSGTPNQGVNAVEAAAEVITHLKQMARRFRDQGPFDAEFNPPYTTVHTGLVQGGTALNIVPKDCAFEFEFRHLPEDDPEALADEVHRFAEEQLLPEMRSVHPGAGFDWQSISTFPGMSITEDAALTRLVKDLSGTNRSGKVSFGTEGGLFQAIGIPAIVCGPGNIDQAHKPDEFIEIAQIERCERFVDDLLGRLD